MSTYVTLKLGFWIVPKLDHEHYKLINCRVQFYKVKSWYLPTYTFWQTDHPMSCSFINKPSYVMFIYKVWKLTLYPYILSARHFWLSHPGLSSANVIVAWMNRVGSLDYSALLEYWKWILLVTTGIKLNGCWWRAMLAVIVPYGPISMYRRSLLSLVLQL